MDCAYQSVDRAYQVDGPAYQLVDRAYQSVHSAYQLVGRAKQFVDRAYQSVECNGPAVPMARKAKASASSPGKSVAYSGFVCPKEGMARPW